MSNFFFLPKSLRDLFATKLANRWQVLLPFSLFYLGLGLLGTTAEAVVSFYEFPLLDVFWLLAVWLILISAGKVFHKWIDQRAALANLLIWLLASALGVVFSIVAVRLITSQPIPDEISSSILLRILVSFVNLGSYLVIISAIFNYRATVKILKSQLAQLVVVRATIIQHLADLKAKYVAEVEQKITPVLAEIQEALLLSDAEAVESQARTAIEDVVIPLTSRIDKDLHDFELGELPAPPSHQVKLKQFFELKVNLQQAFVPIFTGSIFVVSLFPAFQFFYGLDGLLSGLLSLAIILLGQYLIALSLHNRQVSSWLALVAILGMSFLTSTVAGFSIQLLVPDSAPDVDAFLTLGSWLVVFLISLSQLVNTLTADYLRKLADVQSDYGRSLQKRDIEIRQLKRRVTSFIHGDVQGKLRAVLLRVKNGGLTLKNHEALLGDIAYIRKALSLLWDEQQVDFFEQTRGLQEFWHGVCDIRIESSQEVAELLSKSPQLSTNTFDVVSEAVANSVKHAEAKLVKVSLKMTREFVEIRVTNSLAKDLIRNSISGAGSKVFEQLCHSYSIFTDQHEYQLIALIKTQQLMKNGG